MLFEELLRDEYKSGKMEGRIEAKQEDILETLERFGVISGDLSDRIAAIKDLTILKELLVFAASAASLEKFETRLNELVK